MSNDTAALIVQERLKYLAANQVYVMWLETMVMSTPLDDDAYVFRVAFFVHPTKTEDNILQHTSVEVPLREIERLDVVITISLQGVIRDQCRLS